MPDTGEALILERLQVEGGFLDGLDLSFDLGLNVLVGARGTGKTSIIELLRYCTQAPSLADRFGKVAREHALSILRDGKATLTVRTGGERLVIERTERDEPFANGFRRPIVLSQNEIEVVGVDERGRLRLLDDFRTDDGARQRAAHAAMSAIASLSQELADVSTELDALRESVAEHASIVRALAEAREQASRGEKSIVQATAIFAELDLLSEESAAEAVRVRTLDRASGTLQAWEGDIHTALRKAPELESWPGDSVQDPLVKTRTSVERLKADLYRTVVNIHALQNDLKPEREARRKRIAALDDRARELRRQAEALQAGAGAASRRLADLREREAQMRQLAQVIAERESRYARVLADRNAAVRRLEELRELRFGERRQIADRLNRSLNPQVRVRLRKAALHSEYASAIADALRGSGLQYVQLASLLAQHVAPSELAHAVDTDNVSWLADIGEVSVDRAQRVLAHLRKVGMADILAAPIDDGVLLELLDGGRYKPTTSLSTGQRCTVVLPIVLQHAERPIIMDQPEDHLDNAFVVESFVKSLRARATSSQMVVSTHNANIPVLGDARRVSVLGSDGTRGFVRHSAALDSPDVVSSIERIMEGGREAFAARALFYDEASS